MSDKFSYTDPEDVQVVGDSSELTEASRYDKMTLVNPETKNKIRVSTALKYDKSTPAYKLAASIVKKHRAPEEKRIAQQVKQIVPSKFERLPFSKKHAVLNYTQKPLEKKLDRRKRAALNNYVGDGYVRINEYLRKETPASPLVKERIKLLDDVFKQPETVLKHSIVVHRGIRSPKLIKKLIENRRSVFVDNGFISTSLSEGLASDFTKYHDFSAQLKIVVPKGKRALYLQAVGEGLSHEHEVLLPRASRFKIIKFVRRDVTRYHDTKFEIIAQLV